MTTLLEKILTEHRSTIQDKLEGILCKSIPSIDLQEIPNRLLDKLIVAFRDASLSGNENVELDLSWLESDIIGKSEADIENQHFLLLEALHKIKYQLPDYLDTSQQLPFYKTELPIIDHILESTGRGLLLSLQEHIRTHHSIQLEALNAEYGERIQRFEQMHATVDTLLTNPGDYFVLQLDQESNIRHFSLSAQKILGYEEKEIIGEHVKILFPREFVTNGILSDIISKTDKLGHWDGEVSFRGSVGQNIDAHLSLSAIRSPGGDSIGILGMGRDISEQRHLQEQLFKYTSDLQQIVAERNQELEESEERYRRLIEDINEGYFIARGENLIFSNRAFAKITGFTRDELKGHRFLDLVLLRNEKGARNWWQRISETGQNKAVELLIKRRDGKMAVVECKAQPLDLRGKPHVIGVLHDITEKKKMERKLRRYVVNLERIVEDRTKELANSLQELKSTQFQLVQSEKLAGIGILAAGVAHEINNPLQALMLKSQYILRHIDDELKVKRSANDMIQYVNRMAEIVRGLSKYARTVKTEEDWSEVELSEIIKESLELSYHTRNFGDIIVKRDYESVPSVIGNIGKYQQIFINLVVNAIDAMQGKGTLTLRMRKYDSRMVLVEVEDTGCGIPEENMDKIFTPLFTTKPTGKGIGMGLHVAYRIITLYGGEITVNSKEDVGTTFSLFFPIAESNNNEKNVQKEA